jgi:hypothetical protein
MSIYIKKKLQVEVEVELEGEKNLMEVYKGR